MNAKKPTTKKVDNLHQRLNAVRMCLSQPLPKESMIHNQFRAVTHDQITAAVRTLLPDHGISVVHNIEQYKRDGNTVILTGSTTYINSDKPEERESFTWVGEGIDRGDKGIGKAWSYGIKYHYAKMFGLVMGDADEVDQHMTTYVPSATTSKPVTAVKEDPVPSTESQLENVRSLLKQVEEFESGITEKVLQVYKITSLPELNSVQATQVITGLNQKLSAKKENK